MTAPHRIVLGDAIRKEIKGSLAAMGCGTDTPTHWLRHDPKTVWLCTQMGRVGISVTKIRPGDLLDAPPGTGGRSSSGPLPNFAYVLVFADGGLLSEIRFADAGRAAESTVRFAGRFSNGPRHLAEGFRLPRRN